jgi:hypothetical protein
VRSLPFRVLEECAEPPQILIGVIAFGPESQKAIRSKTPKVRTGASATKEANLGLDAFQSPAHLWARSRLEVPDARSRTDRASGVFDDGSGNAPCYCQVNVAIEAIPNKLRRGIGAKRVSLDSRRGPHRQSSRRPQRIAVVPVSRC